MIFFILISCLFALVFMLIAVPFGIKLAHKLLLIDSPKSKRKIHTFPVPVIGGIIIFFTLVLSYFICTPYLDFAHSLIPLSIGLSALLLVVGVIDDKMDVRASYKLIIQFAVAFFMLNSGLADHLFISINQAIYFLQFGVFLFLIVGVINAFNLIDGIDGLAGSLFLIAFLWLTIFAGVYQQFDICCVTGITSASIAGFLYFNIGEKKKIFLGDAGTLSISCLLISCFFLVTIPENQPFVGHFDTIEIGFFVLVSLPVVDAFIVVLNRIKQGKSPFIADKTHIHHRLVSIYNSHKKVSLILVCFILSNMLASLLISCFLPVFWIPILLFSTYSLLYFILNQYEKFSAHKQVLFEQQYRYKMLQKHKNAKRDKSIA